MDRVVPARRPSTASVVINNYNYGAYLADAIESALAQTHPATEVIVVDDGSTDESHRIIARFAGRVVPVLKENGGQTSAFNAGFAASRGEVVCFLDADDLLLPEAMGAAVQALRDPRISKVHWPLWIIDRSGHRTGDLEPPRALDGGDLRQQAIREGPAVYTSSPTSGTAYARSFLQQVFPLPEARHRQSPAGHLKALAPIFGVIEVLPEPLGCYRVHGSSMFQSLTPREKAAFLLDLFDARAALLSHHLRRFGIDADVSTWKESSRYRKWRALVGDPEAAGRWAP
jgi:glycosyltransferase involved in cell wall biosynthesis